MITARNPGGFQVGVFLNSDTHSKCCYPATQKGYNGIVRGGLHRSRGVRDGGPALLVIVATGGMIFTATDSLNRRFERVESRLPSIESRLIRL